jgi:hypothetical protein
MEGPGDGGVEVPLPEDVPEAPPEGAVVPVAGGAVLPAGALFGVE